MFSSMADVNLVCPWKFFASSSPSISQPSSTNTSLQHKAFAQALNYSRDIPYNQLPRPCIKEDAIAIKIPEEEYKAGLEGCRNHLHGRLLLSKGDAPIKFNDLRIELSSLWKPLNQWRMVS